MSQVPISRETLVRKLAFSPRESLASLLDPDDAWRKLAAQIPNSLGQPRYTMLQIRKFEKVVQAGRSPTMELLNDWGTQNCTVGNLVDLLVKLEFYNAADQLLPSSYERRDPFRHITAVPPSSDNGSVCESSLLYSQPCCSPGEWEACVVPPLYTCLGPLYTTMEKEENKEEKEAAGEESGRGNVNIAGLGVGMSLLSTKRAGRESENKEERVVEPTSPTELTVIGIEADVEKFEFTALLRMTGGFNDAPLLQGGSKIGEGGFGLVYLGRIGTNAVAVKKLTALDHVSMESMKTQFTKEIHTLSSCRHENLVELLGYSCDGPQLCLVYPYMSNGSLSERLACKDNTPPLPWATRLSVAEGAAKGIAFLHANNHIHRDIKTANILLDNANVAKVADFGLVRGSGPGGATALTSVVVGTAAYMAPEALRGELTPRADTYSFGVVLLELITGLPAFDSKRTPAVISSLPEELEDGPHTLQDFTDPHVGTVDPERVDAVYQLALRCLEDRKGRRPAMSEVSSILKEMSATCMEAAGE
ncbi:interleukin-1 receptor-associated kinase 4 [Lethenteron reissneri]|uniref:interleukin-1 receptor-associated kinase 4 n=1 Tax=Lethenteron reissneri TaxID=7753 RepID=UPI002AB78372|nr:interleukin-1 receptor-associated kinase 4 [Lethenteron reissneri]XP_061422891.1 interleukin-1 receptor-associated kinase 4 [Lethenteron reissneri]